MDWLRHEHPRDTAKHVAARTRQPVRTVEKWLAGETWPKAGALLTLIGAYGPEFLAVLMPQATWLTDAAKRARKAKIEAEMAELAALAAALDD